MSPAYDVVVSGAGVAGLVATAALTQRGYSVLLLDKQRRPAPVHKGEVLQPRSVQILRALGALDALLADGALSAPELVCRRPDGRRLAALDYSALPAPDDHLLVHYYSAICDGLTAALGTPVEVRRGVSVLGPVRDDAGRVTGVRVRAGDGEEEITAALVLSCEGTGSRLARALQLDVPVTRYAHRLLALDLRPGLPDAVTEVCAYLTPRGLRLLYPMPRGAARLYVQVDTEEYRQVGRAGSAAWLRRALADVPALAPLTDDVLAALPSMQPMGATRYLAPRWSAPGLALVGDAAHAVHPMAGQGMNAAIADAWSLAASLSRAGGLAPAQVDDAVTAYEEERRPAMAYVSRLSHNLATAFTDTRPSARLLAQLMLRRNSDNRRLQSLVTFNMSGLGVRRFTPRDRLYQFGLLADPAGSRPADLSAQLAAAVPGGRPTLQS